MVNDFLLISTIREGKNENREGEWLTEGRKDIYGCEISNNGNPSSAFVYWKGGGPVGNGIPSEWVLDAAILSLVWIIGEHAKYFFWWPCKKMSTSSWASSSKQQGRQIQRNAIGMEIVYMDKNLETDRQICSLARHSNIARWQHQTQADYRSRLLLSPETRRSLGAGEALFRQP